MKRIILVGVSGALITVTLLAVSRAVDGIAKGPLLVMALFAAAVTVGLIIAFVAEDYEATRNASRFDGLPRSAREGRHNKTRVKRCATCRSLLVNLETFWLCPACDQVEATG